MRKSTFPILYGILALALSCTGEPGQESAVTVSFTIRNHAFPTKSSCRFAEDKISTVFLAAYDKNGSLANTCFVEDYRSGTNLSLELQGGRTYNFYALANIGKPDEALYSDEDAIKNLEIDLSGYSCGAFPMCHAFSRTVSMADMEVLELQRLVSRLDLAMNRSNLPDLVIDCIEVKQAASRVYPFCADRLPQNYDILPLEGDKSSSIDLAAINDGGMATLYIPENLQGTLLPDNKDPRAKQGGDDSELAARYDVKNLTYIEIKAHFDQSGGHPEFEGEIIYRFYPGRDNTSNFDIARNSHHHIVFTPSYESATSAQISWQLDNTAVQSISYGHLEVWSVDSSGGRINLLSDESGISEPVSASLTAGFSSGEVRAYFIQDEDGLAIDVTSETQWSFQGGSQIEFSQTGNLSAANATSSSIENISVKYGKYNHVTFPVTILGRDTPDVTYSISNLPGTQRLPLNSTAATDPQTSKPVSCTVFSSTYSHLGIAVNYNPEKWEKIRIYNTAAFPGSITTVGTGGIVPISANFKYGIYSTLFSDAIQTNIYNLTPNVHINQGNPPASPGIVTEVISKKDIWEKSLSHTVTSPEIRPALELTVTGKVTYEKGSTEKLYVDYNFNNQVVSGTHTLYITKMSGQNKMYVPHEFYFNTYKSRIACVSSYDSGESVNWENNYTDQYKLPLMTEYYYNQTMFKKYYNISIKEQQKGYNILYFEGDATKPYPVYFK